MEPPEQDEDPVDEHLLDLDSFVGDREAPECPLVIGRDPGRSPLKLYKDTIDHTRAMAGVARP